MKTIYYRGLCSCSVTQLDEASKFEYENLYLDINLDINIYLCHVP